MSFVILEQRFKMIRFGIDKSMNPNVQNYSLQSFVNQHLTNNNDIGKEERAQMESQVRLIFFFFFKEIILIFCFSLEIIFGNEISFNAKIANTRELE